MPRSRRVSEPGPSTPSPQKQTTRNNNVEREPVRSDDLCVGCIVWLPPKDPNDLLSPEIKCCRQHGCNGYELGDGGYDHPVVVLSVYRKDDLVESDDVVCACLTSFGATPLATFLAERTRMTKFQKAIPIVPYDAEPEIDLSMTTALHLEKDKLHVQSYVERKHTYIVPASMLRQYRKSSVNRLRLDEKSYQMLMHEFGLVPEVFESIVASFETSLTHARSNSLGYQNPYSTTQIPAPPYVGYTRTNVSQPRIVFPPVRSLSNPARYAPAFQDAGQTWAGVVSQSPVVPAPVPYTPAATEIIPALSQPADFTNYRRVTNRYGHQTTSQYGYQTNSQNGYQTNSQYGYQTNFQYGNQTNFQYGHQTNSQYGYQINSQYGYQTNAPQYSLPNYHQPPSTPPQSENIVLSSLTWIAGALGLGSFVWWRYGE